MNAWLREKACDAELLPVSDAVGLPVDDRVLVIVADALEEGVNDGVGLVDVVAAPDGDVDGLGVLLWLRDPVCDGDRDCDIEEDGLALGDNVGDCVRLFV